jgi:hypothetical protein
MPLPPQRYSLVFETRNGVCISVKKNTAVIDEGSFQTEAEPKKTLLEPAKSTAKFLQMTLDVCCVWLSGRCGPHSAELHG